MRLIVVLPSALPLTYEPLPWCQPLYNTQNVAADTVTMSVVIVDHKSAAVADAALQSICPLLPRPSVVHRADNPENVTDSPVQDNLLKPVAV